MAAQVIVPAAPDQPKTSPATIALPSGFEIQSQDGRLDQEPNRLLDNAPVPLGVLANFTKTFAGTGFNLIFRPNSSTTFPIPVSPTSDNVLELNLTTETLSFSDVLGSVPNRGLLPQNDIFLNGVSYVQVISDVSNPVTGQADGTPSGIHFEPGLWMHVPATTVDPVLGESLTRMASIPHGTTINAQCLAPTTSVAGPPEIAAVDITPFVSTTGQKIPFPSQTASNNNTPRLPQDLTKFLETGTITQDMLNNPNIVLSNAITGMTITKTTFFTVSTTPAPPELGGGTANIAFLQGASTGTNSGPNATAVQMSATFWIEEVQHSIEIPVFKPGQKPFTVRAPSPASGAQAPTFQVLPPHEITEPTTINVTSIQIQYSQTVLLNFNGLTWPHVSCATLIPTEPLSVPGSAFD